MMMRSNKGFKGVAMFAAMAMVWSQAVPAGFAGGDDQFVQNPTNTYTPTMDPAAPPHEPEPAPEAVPMPEDVATGKDEENKVDRKTILEGMEKEAGREEKKNKDDGESNASMEAYGRIHGLMSLNEHLARMAQESKGHGLESEAILKRLEAAGAGPETTAEFQARLNELKTQAASNLLSLRENLSEILGEADLNGDGNFNSDDVAMFKKQLFMSHHPETPGDVENPQTEKLAEDIHHFFEQMTGVGHLHLVHMEGFREFEGELRDTIKNFKQPENLSSPAPRPAPEAIFHVSAENGIVKVGGMIRRADPNGRYMVRIGEDPANPLMEELIVLSSAGQFEMKLLLDSPGAHDLQIVDGGGRVLSHDDFRMPPKPEPEPEHEIKQAPDVMPVPENKTESKPSVVPLESIIQILQEKYPEAELKVLNIRDRECADASDCTIEVHYRVENRQLMGPQDGGESEKYGPRPYPVVVYRAKFHWNGESLELLGTEPVRQNESRDERIMAEASPIAPDSERTEVESQDVALDTAAADQPAAESAGEDSVKEDASSTSDASGAEVQSGAADDISAPEESVPEPAREGDMNAAEDGVQDPVENGEDAAAEFSEDVPGADPVMESMFAAPLTETVGDGGSAIDPVDAMIREFDAGNPDGVFKILNTQDIPMESDSEAGSLLREMKEVFAGSENIQDSTWHPYGDDGMVMESDAGGEEPEIAVEEKREIAATEEDILSEPVVPEDTMVKEEEMPAGKEESLVSEPPYTSEQKYAIFSAAQDFAGLHEMQAELQSIEAGDSRNSFFVGIHFVKPDGSFIAYKGTVFVETNDQTMGPLPYAVTVKFDPALDTILASENDPAPREEMTLRTLDSFVTQDASNPDPELTVVSEDVAKEEIVTETAVDDPVSAELPVNRMFAPQDQEMSLDEATQLRSQGKGEILDIVAGDPNKPPREGCVGITAGGATNTAWFCPNIFNSSPSEGSDAELSIATASAQDVSEAPPVVAETPIKPDAEAEIVAAEAPVRDVVDEEASLAADNSAAGSIEEPKSEVSATEEAAREETNSEAAEPAEVIQTMQPAAPEAPAPEVPVSSGSGVGIDRAMQSISATRNFQKKLRELYAQLVSLRLRLLPKEEGGFREVENVVLQPAEGTAAAEEAAASGGEAPAESTALQLSMISKSATLAYMASFDGIRTFNGEEQRGTFGADVRILPGTENNVAFSNIRFVAPWDADRMRRRDEEKRAAADVRRQQIEDERREKELAREEEKKKRDEKEKADIENKDPVPIIMPPVMLGSETAVEEVVAPAGEGETLKEEALEKALPDEALTKRENAANFEAAPLQAPVFAGKDVTNAAAVKASAPVDDPAKLEQEARVRRAQEMRMNRLQNSKVSDWFRKNGAVGKTVVSAKKSGEVDEVKV